MRSERLVKAALLLGIALTMQASGLRQVVVGPVVNAVLFASPVVAGAGYGTMIGMLTPWGAVALGTLNPGLVAAVPFIMAGNVTLVLLFSWLRRYWSWGAVLPAAVAKYLVISLGAYRILGINPLSGAALGAPQLVNALIGGAAAWALLALREVHRAKRHRPPEAEHPS